MNRGIYKIINIINNKFYIGSAVDLKRRKARHFSELRNNKHNNRHLQAAWTKYGEQSFVFVVVELVDIADDLLAAENRWLKEHVGKDYCYNIGVDATAPMLGVSGEASPTWGYKHTQKAIESIRAASIGRKQSDEVIQRKIINIIGKPKPAAVRAKISATLSGEGNFWYGKKRPDHGAKISKRVRVVKPDGSVTEYASILALREELGLKPPTVNRALQSGKPITRGKFVGWVFQYVE